jgi:hypothetical protein
VAGQKQIQKTSSATQVIWLVHPGPGDSERVAELNRLGYCVVGGPWSSPEIIRKKSALPCSVIIDLSRSPSTGRDIAVAMRSHSGLVNIPFIIVEGAPDRVTALKKLLPDAFDATWPRIRTALNHARAIPPSGGRKLSVFAAYEGKPLAQKLGIKPGAIVATVSAPPGFRALLGALPEGAKIQNAAATRDLTLWFVRSTQELTERIVEMKPHAASGRLWIIWRKGEGAALNQNSIRKAALESGLVDFRISRIDDEWAGLRFTVRQRKRSKWWGLQSPSKGK